MAFWKIPSEGGSGGKRGHGGMSHWQSTAAQKKCASLARRRDDQSLRTVDFPDLPLTYGSPPRSQAEEVYD